MPTYEYVCTRCGAPLTVVQSIHEPSLTDCPACGEGRLRKVFGNVGVVFKGSGFYRTDSRSGRGSAKGSGNGSGRGATDRPAKGSEGTSSTGAEPAAGGSAAGGSSTGSAGTSSGSTGGSSASSGSGGGTVPASSASRTS